MTRVPPHLRALVGGLLVGLSIAVLLQQFGIRALTAGLLVAAPLLLAVGAVMVVRVLDRSSQRQEQP